jgi:hypothetical protein
VEDQTGQAKKRCPHEGGRLSKVRGTFPAVLKYRSITEYDHPARLERNTLTFAESISILFNVDI